MNMEDGRQIELSFFFVTDALMQYAAESREIFLFFQIFEIKLANLKNNAYLCAVKYQYMYYDAVSDYT